MVRKTIYVLTLLLVLSACSRGSEQAVQPSQSLVTAAAPAATATPLPAMPTAAPTAEQPVMAAATAHDMGADQAPEAHKPHPGAHPVTQHSHVSDGLHIETAPGGQPTEAELRQAAKIRSAALARFAKYRDYREALKDGYSVFAEEVPQDVYHFINYRESLRNHGAVDPLRPSALLYRKTGEGWEWYGVMYSTPYETGPSVLDQIYPRSLGEWHAHVNICTPPNAGDWMSNLEAAVSDPQFGFEGAIATRAQCEAAGGRFHRDVLGWMVHIDLSASE